MNSGVCQYQTLPERDPRTGPKAGHSPKGYTNHMPWEMRGGCGPYYTRSRRIAGRTVRDYIGCGPLAEHAAAEDAARRAHRDDRVTQWKRTKAAVTEANQALSTLSKTVDAVTNAYLHEVGYRRHHRGEWRRRRVSMHDTNAASTFQSSTAVERVVDGQVSSREDLTDLMREAAGGDERAMARVTQILDAGPGAWEAIADLTVSAEKSWIELLAGDNMLLREALRHKVASLKSDATGPAPTPLERLLAERIAVSWLAVQEADHFAARLFKDGGTTAQARYAEERQERAQRRLLGAIRSLAQVRRLLTPAMQINIAGAQVNMAS